MTLKNPSLREIVVIRNTLYYYFVNKREEVGNTSLLVEDLLDEIYHAIKEKQYDP